MLRLKNLSLWAVLFGLTLFFSCNDDSSTPSESGTSNISIRLVDEPGDFEHVYVNVVDVMVKVNDTGTGDEGWVSLDPINTGIYDLLELTGGVNVLLVDDFQIPSGMLNQIRLVLGEEGNTVVIDGETFPLNTPSAQQSGLKIQVNQVLEPGFTYDYILDFDVDQSIVIAGNSGNINLKPVIHASAEVSSGIIQGAVNPFNFQVNASVEVDGETISTYIDDSGNFMLYGVPGGIYTLTLTPDPASGYIPTLVEGVEVINGQITDLGTIDLQLAPVVGSITGTVLNAGITATASVMVDGELVEAMTNELGVFLLSDIPVGIYTVTVTPEEGSGLTPTEFTNVEVTEDTITDLGEITLS